MFHCAVPLYAVGSSATTEEHAMEQCRLTLERLKEVLDYNPLTGIFVWKIRPSRNSRRKAGDVAGTVQLIGDRYHCYIGIDGEDYSGSKLAWFYTYGIWPDFRLAYKDDNSAHLAINNLVKRLPTQAFPRKQRSRPQGSRADRPEGDGLMTKGTEQ